jgi:nucleolar pre-ribosomal-associated protein 1
LYDRAEDERSDTASGEEQIPADVAHHFLLAITTRPGVGVCFKDRGWYPRQEESFTPENVHDEAEEDEATTVKRGGGKIHNRILANLLKALKVNEDPRQLELAIRVLEAAPELVSG